MILSDVSIKRPVFATVISLLIVVFGVSALRGLPVREYPDIDPPVVSIATSYTGAAAEVVDTQITQVIEGAISSIEGVRSVESSTEQGESRTNIEFNADRDIDIAANDVRDAVSRVLAELPEAADPPVVSKADSDARPMMWVTLMSDVWDSAELSDFAERVLVDRLSVLDGVADVQIGGQRRYAIRIWLDRERLASRNITVAEVEQALRSNNIELPAGSIESTARDFTVRAEGRLSTVEEFRELVIRRSGNKLLRLGEIADVKMGVESDVSRLRSNAKTAIGLGIIRQSKSNTVAVSDLVSAELEKIPAHLTTRSDDFRKLRRVDLHSRLDQGGAVYPWYRRRARHTRHIHLSQVVASDAYSGGYHTGQHHWRIHRPGQPGIFDQRVDAIGHHSGHWSGCRRCHRHAGKHSATHR